jgi:hypothetical protein
MIGRGIIPLPNIPLPLQLSAQKDFLTEGNEGNEEKYSGGSDIECWALNVEC